MRLPSFLSSVLLPLCCTVAVQAAEVTGAISGIVVNLSQGRTPVGGANVALRAIVDGDYLVVAESVTDAQGRFRFEEVPVGDEYAFVPGANHADIHYPGPRLRLDATQTEAHVEIGVYDAVSYPTPLVIRRHDIRVRVEPGAVHVAEEIVIENPSNLTFIGQPPPGGPEPVTLELSIPSDFERTTFQKEFFGRRFALIGGKLVTGVPWLPGRQELKFSYVLRNTGTSFRWRRGVDLPCDELVVCIETDQQDKVACNLPESPRQESGAVLFAPAGKQLAPGDVVQVDLGAAPVSAIASARWLALGALAALIGGVSILTARRGCKTAVAATDTLKSKTKPLHTSAQPRRSSALLRRSGNP